MGSVMALWIKVGIFGAVCVLLIYESSGNPSLSTSETCSIVDKCIDHGIDRFERLERRQKKLRKSGIDGRTEGRARVARRIKRIRSKVEEELTVILLEASKSLLNRTDMTFAEINGDEQIMGCWEVEFGDVANGQSGTSYRKRRETGDEGDDNESAGDAINNLCSSSFNCSGVSDTYRRIDGRCNNLENPLWGAAFTTQPRFMDPDYADGVSEPRQAVGGGELPSPREISNILFSDDTPTRAEVFNTLMSLNWGQFLDHDFVLTPVNTGENGASIACCNDTTDEAIDREECMAIEIPSGDSHFTPLGCMPFVRSSIAPNENCSPGPKQVLNQLTSFIDASNVYGSSDDESLNLRYKDDNTSMDSWLSNANNEMLPNTTGNCVLSDTADACCKAGDGRVNTQPGLALLHLLFVREHNRIVGKLREVGFPEENLFEEARKIIGALVQQITYGEYLLNVFNEDTMQDYGLNLQDSGFANEYDSSINPGIHNAFAAAAFRFGHSQIPDTIAYLLSDWNTPDEETDMEVALLDPHLLVTQSGSRVPDLTRYMIDQRARRVDRFFEDSIRNTLFGGLDLTSLNIQRGRDHGLPPYVAWTEYCGFSVANDFSQLANHTNRARNRLSNIYNDVADIDLYAGALSETRLTSSYVGPTFNCILAEQFRALKKGDRFWYENGGSTGFSTNQLTQIRRVRLSKILCNNLGITMAQRNVLRQPNNNNNGRTLCTDLPDMDFQPWSPTK